MIVVLPVVGLKVQVGSSDPVDRMKGYCNDNEIRGKKRCRDQEIGRNQKHEAEGEAKSNIGGQIC